MGPPGGYSRIVFVAHSQGTVLTTALLNEHQPALLGRDVRLVTFGSPLRQLYHRRLPRQFAWVGTLHAHDALRRHLPQVGEWWNLATPGDLVGRTVTRDVPPGAWRATDRASLDGALPGVPRDVLLSAGGHGAYWDDPVLYELLDDQVS